MEENAYYFGRGRVYLTPALAAVGGVSAGGGTNWSAVALRSGTLRMPPGRFIGNVKTLELAVQTEPLNVPDFLTTEENDYPPYVVREVGVSFAMLRNDGANLAGHFGAHHVAIVGHKVSETIATGQASVGAGGMVYVDHAIDRTKPVTVVPSWTDWTAGVHYEVEEYGLRLLQGFAGPVGATIEIGYTTEGGAEEIEALQRRHEVGLVYVGVNLITGQPARVDCYRVALRPGEKYAPLNEQSNELLMAGALKAVRPAGQGRARWFRIMRGGLGG